jgi:hypothetical protein
MAQVTFTGEVVYTHNKFIAVKEEGERGKRWQVWTTGPQKGDVVTVTGELKTKVGEPYTGNDGVESTVDHAVNNATIAAQAGAQTPVQAPPAEWDQQQWGAVAGDNDTPF